MCYKKTQIALVYLMILSRDESFCAIGWQI